MSRYFLYDHKGQYSFVVVEPLAAERRFNRSQRNVLKGCLGTKPAIFMSTVFFCISKHDFNPRQGFVEGIKKVRIKYLTFVKLTWVSWLFVRTNGFNKARLGKIKNKKGLNTFKWFLYLFGLDNIPFKKENIGIFTQKLMFSDILLSLSLFSIGSETRKHLQLADVTFNGFHQSERSVLRCTPSVRSGLWSIHSSYSSPGLLTFPSFGCIDI